MKDFGKIFISSLLACLAGHYLATERIIDSCADFEKFKSRGVTYECKPVPR